MHLKQREIQRAERIQELKTNPWLAAEKISEHYVVDPSDILVYSKEDLERINRDLSSTVGMLVMFRMYVNPFLPDGSVSLEDADFVACARLSGDAHMAESDTLHSPGLLPMEDILQSLGFERNDLGAKELRHLEAFCHWMARRLAFHRLLVRWAHGG